MEIFTILGVLAIVGIAVFFYAFAVPPAQNTDKVVLFDTSMPGSVQQSIPLALPRSYNQPEGMTYSYTSWILVKDFTKGYGQRRRIFSKGDSPGLYIDSTSNSFVVAIDTYGTTETILIPNIPAMKWIHFAMVVDQHAVDIYINGILRKHHTLGQLPQLNDMTVTVGSNWEGVLARLSYYSRSLNHVEIKSMVKEKVPDDLQREAAPPNYFDISWYIGRLYSA
jgi:hypothetical protein